MSDPGPSHVPEVYAHHLGDYFPIDRQSFTQMLELERTGIWNWTYDERCNNANILSDVAGAFDDTSQRYAVWFQYGSGQANISTCAAHFVGKCGPEAVACVGADSPGYPRNCDAYYNGVYMATFWSFASRKSIVKHEWMHCGARRAEDYDDDRTDGTSNLRCIPSDSIMGCGPEHPLDYSARDDAAWAKEHFPDGAVAYGSGRNAGGLYLYWCSNSAQAALTAIMKFDSNGYTWTGIHAPVNYSGCQGWHVPEIPGTCYYINEENALNYSRGEWRNDKLVTCL